MFEFFWAIAAKETLYTLKFTHTLNLAWWTSTVSFCSNNNNNTYSFCSRRHRNFCCSCLIRFLLIDLLLAIQKNSLPLSRTRSWRWWFFYSPNSLLKWTKLSKKLDFYFTWQKIFQKTRNTIKCNNKKKKTTKITSYWNKHVCFAEPIST